MLRDRSNSRRPLGERELSLMLSMMMATAALATDVMLPAFPQIRQALGLAPGSPRVGMLVTSFFLGMAVAQIPLGLASDTFGRKTILRVGLGLYLLGAIAAMFAPSTGWMYLARFVWGCGAGGPRVVSLAIVRDRYSSTAMARVMSMVMAVFIMVPIVAPSLGAGLVALGSWRYTFALCAIAAVALLVWSSRLPETLRPEDRRPMRIGPIAAAAHEVLRHRTTVLMSIAMTISVGAFIGYLSSAETMVNDILGLDGWFPYIFGAIAAGLGVASLANGRFVHRVGLWPALRWVSPAYLLAAVVVTVIAIAGHGVPPAWQFLPAFAVLAATQQSTMPNANAAAMEPMGAVAGTASALVGASSMGLGSILGGVISDRVHTTVTPVAVGFLISAVSLWALVLACGPAPTTTASAAPATAASPGQRG